MVIKLFVSSEIIKEIIEEKTNINTEIGLRLAKYFSLSEKFWLNLQMKYDLEIIKDNERKSFRERN